MSHFLLQTRRWDLAKLPRRILTWGFLAEHVFNMRYRDKVRAGRRLCSLAEFAAHFVF